MSDLNEEVVAVINKGLVSGDKAILKGEKILIERDGCVRAHWKKTDVQEIVGSTEKVGYVLYFRNESASPDVMYYLTGANSVVSKTLEVFNETS